MKHIYVFLLLVLFSLYTSAQEEALTRKVDSSLLKKITINGFCLCRTTVADLRNLDKNLKEVTVEEMDGCKDGFVEDARFVNRKGYYSEKFKGMIFQQEKESDIISKIRLTKDFKGDLPDGTSINMNNLLAKDVLKRYPKLPKMWMSRGCSDYWNLTDDTLSFFVKIDKSRKPQYPVDEAYYSEKPIEGIDLVVSCYQIFDKPRFQQLLSDPVIFVDSVNVTRMEMIQYTPSQIASVSVYKDSNALKLVGPQGKYGVVYIQTKKFARTRYWNFFKEKSPDYLKTVPTPDSDSTVAYILNGKVLGENAEATLFEVTETTFISLRIIPRNILIRDFKVTDKLVGVSIETRSKEK